MANETNAKKEEIRQARVAADSTTRELQQTVEALPRTDHMTLPAIQITEIDPQTRARAEAIVAINNATQPDEVINEDGKTLQEVRNEFEFGVTNLDDEAGKHEIQVNESEGNVADTVVIIPPVRVVQDAKGEEVEVQDAEVVIEPTPANIAPIDADAPHDPVEAREAAGLNPDGSEGDAQVIPGSAQGATQNAVPAREAAPQEQPKNMGTQQKVGAGQDAEGKNTGGNTATESPKTV